MPAAVKPAVVAPSADHPIRRVRSRSRFQAGGGLFLAQSIEIAVHAQALVIPLTVVAPADDDDSHKRRVQAAQPRVRQETVLRQGRESGEQCEHVLVAVAREPAADTGDLEYDVRVRRGVIGKTLDRLPDALQQERVQTGVFGRNRVGIALRSRPAPGRSPRHKSAGRIQSPPCRDGQLRWIRTRTSSAVTRVARYFDLRGPQHPKLIERPKQVTERDPGEDGRPSPR